VVDKQPSVERMRAEAAELRFKADELMQLASALTEEAARLEDLIFRYEYNQNHGPPARANVRAIPSSLVNRCSILPIGEAEDTLSESIDTYSNVALKDLRVERPEHRNSTTAERHQIAIAPSG